MENLVTIKIRSTNYYLIDTGQGMFMVDAGWAGALPALRAQLKNWKLDLSNIRFLMITHHHPDHAGLAQEIKQASGARLVILDKQVPFLENLKSFYEGKGGYEPIRVEKNDLVLGTDNRKALKSIGIQGEMIETPGHSDDRVSLVLDSGMAFIGDLHPPEFVGDEERELTRRSWEKLRQRNARMIYPAHGNPFRIDNVIE